MSGRCGVGEVLLTFLGPAVHEGGAHLLSVAVLPSPTLCRVRNPLPTPHPPTGEKVCCANGALNPSALSWEASALTTRLAASPFRSDDVYKQWGKGWLAHPWRWLLAALFSKQVCYAPGVGNVGGCGGEREPSPTHGEANLKTQTSHSLYADYPRHKNPRHFLPGGQTTGGRRWTTGSEEERSLEPWREHRQVLQVTGQPAETSKHSERKPSPSPPAEDKESRRMKSGCVEG